MTSALAQWMRQFHVAIRNHDKAVATADDSVPARLAGHCRHLLAAPGTASWITEQKRREILADLNKIDMRDAYEQSHQSAYLETLNAFRP